MKIGRDQDIKQPIPMALLPNSAKKDFIRLTRVIN